MGMGGEIEASWTTWTNSKRKKKQKKKNKKYKKKRGLKGKVVYATEGERKWKYNASRFLRIASLHLSGGGNSSI
jgi:hypothetical protein